MYFSACTKLDYHRTFFCTIILISINTVILSDSFVHASYQNCPEFSYCCNLTGDVTLAALFWFHKTNICVYLLTSGFFLHL